MDGLGLDSADVIDEVEVASEEDESEEDDGVVDDGVEEGGEGDVVDETANAWSELEDAVKLGREDVEEIELVVDGTVDDESCTEVDGDVTELEEVRSGEAELEEIELVVDGRANDESRTEVEEDVRELEEVRSRGAGVEETELSRMRYTLSNEMLVDAPKPLQEPCR
jgi:hypothetical protein